MEIKKFPENMGAFKIDPHKMHNSVISGFFEEEIDVHGTTRKFYTYLTEDLTNSRPCFIIAPPSDVEAAAFMEQSGLVALAAQEKAYIFLLSPENGTWDNTGKDAEYANLVFARIHNRDRYICVQECIYIFGFGDGATVAHEAAIMAPENWSGVATLGAIDNAVEEFIRKHAFAQGPVQMPAYLALTESNKASDLLLTYWKAQNDADVTPLSGDGAQEIYLPKTLNKKTSLNDQKIAQIRVCHEGSEYANLRENIAKFWRFLKLYRRHRGVARKHMRYFADWEQYGAELHTMEVDGFTRMWYEYVPESVKKKGGKAPLVAVMHGRTQSSEIIFDLTSMSWAAEEYGFIAVFPRGGIYQMDPKSIPNVPLWTGHYAGKDFDDVKFITSMIQDVASRREVDMERIYGCGFSSGGMMSYLLGIHASDLFAAICCFSGFAGLESSEDNGPAAMVPSHKLGVELIMGLSDPFFGNANADNPYKTTQLVADSIVNWTRAMDCEAITGSYSLGGRHYLVHTTKAGVPLFTMCSVDDMPHSVYPSEAFEACEFFAKYSKKNGKLYYMGREV